MPANFTQHSVDLDGTIEHSTGMLVKFHLRALRVLRGYALPLLTAERRVARIGASSRNPGLLIAAVALKVDRTSTGTPPIGPTG
jgi:hypothetical protein